MKTVLLITNSSQSIINFRLPLIRALRKKGYNVETLSFDNDREEELKKEGIVNHCVHGRSRSVNPFASLVAKKTMTRIISELAPYAVFTFMAKPNIFGVQAARKAHVNNIFSMVEGAGDPFQDSPSLKWRIIKKIECWLYKKSFKYSKKVFFLNEDDAKEFCKLKLVHEDQIALINGIGVDLQRFSPKPVNPKSNAFIMVSRMLKTKGVLDFCKCAEMVKKVHPEAEFLYAGGEGDVRLADIRPFLETKTINYMGNVEDVRPHLEKSLMIILPSYREGKPMSVMEAECMGRGALVYNAIGSKDTVIDGFNGYVVEKKDIRAMADKCIYLLDNKEIAIEMGHNARKFAEENYDQARINADIIQTLSL